VVPFVGPDPPPQIGQHPVAGELLGARHVPMIVRLASLRILAFLTCLTVLT
jgi:hypothetical protein